MNILKRSYLFSVVMLIGILVLFSCNRTTNRNLDIDTRNVSIQPVEIARYEQALFSINPDSMKAGLKEIAADFPVFLNVDLDDTLNIYQLHQFVTEPVNRQLYEMVTEKYRFYCCF